MDPAALAILVKGLVPLLGALVFFGTPVAIVFTVKYFKLRHRELELEAELHGKQTQARLAAIEARLGTLETAIGALARTRRGLDAGPSFASGAAALLVRDARRIESAAAAHALTARVRARLIPGPVAAPSRELRACYTHGMHLVEGKKQRRVDR